VSDPTLVCVGNLTADEAVAPDGRRTESVGGDALFAALGARLARGAARVLAPLGNDAGPALLDALRRAGTDPGRLPRRPLPGVRTTVHYRPDGSRTWTLVHGDDHFERLSVTPEDIDADDLAAEGILLCGMALHAQLALAAWVRPRTAATVYFDPQEDYLPGNEAALRSAVSRCDVFLPSEVEAVALSGHTDPAAAARAFLDLGPHTVVVKRAEAGCLVSTRDAPGPVHVPADVVDPVDSTGAGDAFCGAFAAEHLRTGDPVAAARVATAVARVAVSGPGPDGLLAAVTAEAWA
jgi:sugar/nucleoside kinase (ribokinase family)